MALRKEAGKRSLKGVRDPRLERRVPERKRLTPRTLGRCRCSTWC